MEPVTTSSSWQPPSASAMPTRAPPRRMARLRSWGGLVIIVHPRFASVGNEAVSAAVVLGRFGPAGHAVHAFHVPQQLRLTTRRPGKTNNQTQQVLCRHRANDIGGHEHGQL